MASQRVVLLSLWQNDIERNLAGRIWHLLEKTYKPMRYVWVVGDSQDDTEMVLRAVARYRADKDITIVRHDTGIGGDDSNTRLRRMSETADAGLDAIAMGDGYVCIHESDLRTPRDVVERFMGSGYCPVGGWPELVMPDGGRCFYDTWGIRFNGQLSSNGQQRPPCPARVTSLGSVWMMHAEDIRAGVRCNAGGCVRMCEQLIARGRAPYVLPDVEVIQPSELWVSRAHADL